MNQYKPTSTRPYFVRAIYEWCTDNGFTPYLGVKVDKNVQVPTEFVHQGEIVLNISFDATSGLEINNDHIRFQARFAGVAREIIVPVSHVIAIYARENGQGMQFPMPADGVVAQEQSASLEGDADDLVGGEDGLPASTDNTQAIHLVSDSGDDDPHAEASGTSTQRKGQNHGQDSKKPSLRIVK